MFCPKCKCEYRESSPTCPDCEVPLVEDLAGEKGKKPGVANEHIDLELIFSTYVYSDISQIKSVFDSEGIAYFVQGEDIGIAPGGLQAKVFVNKDQAEEAKQLLKDFNLL